MQKQKHIRLLVLWWRPSDLRPGVRIPFRPGQNTGGLMSTSRRKFLKTGMLAAMFAAIPLRNVAGQSWKDRDGNPGEAPVVQGDPLSNYSRATFKSYLNSIFALHTVFGIVAVTLLKVDDLPSSRGGECFSLLFRGGSRALRQETYV